jgi:hypothetical protein
MPNDIMSQPPQPGSYPHIIAVSSLWYLAGR